MAWTKNRRTAEHFARVRQPHDELGRAWVATFTPSRLLAYLADEQEYLVDAAGADVQPAPSQPP